MAEGKTTRLNKVLRELNISLDRAVEHLSKNGHDIEARPTTKISGEIYQVLLDGFQNDKTKKAASKEVGEEKRKEKEAIRLELEPTTISVLEGNVAPGANFDMSVTSGVAPLTVSFDASTSSDMNGDNLEYFWDFGDGTTGNGVNVNHNYTIIGEYVISLTVNDGVLSDSKVSTLTVSESTGTTTCSFGVPMENPLPTLSNSSYDYIYVLGEGGPDLSNVADFTINWDLQNNGLWQCSMNINNGNPAWWIDLTASIVSQTFNQVQPTITFSGTEILNFDGSYDVAIDGNNLVLVSKSGTYTMYFSNENSSPNCEGLLKDPFIEDDLITVKAFPNPVTDYLTLQSNQDFEGAFISVVDINGRVLSSKRIQKNLSEIKLDMNMFQSGIYFIQIKKNQKTVIKQITK
jgi:PKD repeat protein